MHDTYSILRWPEPVRTRQLDAGTPAPPRSTVPPELETARLSKDELLKVVRAPEVLAVAPTMPTRLVVPVAADEAVPEPGPTWGVRAVGADRSARTGAGVNVAVLDTGIDVGHPAFAGVDLMTEDFSGSGSGTGDVHGHGTHCAGTVLGRDVDGTRIGVAPGVERALIGKVLGDDGRGDSTMLFNAIQWSVREGAHVVSMSLGFDFPGLVAALVEEGWPADLATSAALEGYRANLRMFDALMRVIAVQEPFGHGTIVVAAAGNESRRDLRPDYEIAAALPAAADDVVSVGALGQAPEGLTVATFSNTFPRVAAPGVDVVSARAGGGLTSFSGTSMATPHVAGVAALWWEEVLSSALPPTADTVTSRMLAHSDLDALAPGVDVADRGAGIVRAP